MRNVLIVDDEPKQREGLARFIPWESYGFVVAGTAANAFEALDKHKELRPSLMVVDIRMPGMDGLELVQALRKVDPKLHILILSGYADFEYAKRAISERADGYLLKPVDEDEMVTYLERIQAACVREQEEEALGREAASWNREVLVQSLLKASAPLTPGLLNKAEHLGMLWKEYQMLVIELFPPEHAAPETVEQVLRRTADWFEQGGRGIGTVVQSQVNIVLRTPLSHEQLREEACHELQHLLGSSFCFTAAIGSKVLQLTDLRRSYMEAKELIRNKFYFDNGRILHEPLTLPIDAVGEGLDLSALEEQMYYALDIGNGTQLKSLIRNYGQTLVTQGQTEQEIKRKFAELMTQLLTKLSLRQSEDFEGLKGYTEQFAQLYQQHSIYSLYEHLDQMLNCALHQGGSRTKEQEVKNMLDLIHRNYSDNLKLETLAGIFNYNSAYLGKLFRNATGEYFNTYLDKVRIEQAKKYLQEGMKVYQVAEKVGYTNVDYFHSKFRKYVGTSPSVYRKGAANE